jgi:hypothetical protein
VLLKQIFNDNLCKSQSNGSLYVLNKACTGQFIIKKVFEHFPSIILTFVCLICLDGRSREDIIVIVNLPTDNLIFLQNVMENYEFLPSKCKKCEISMVQSLDYKEI